MYIPDVIRDHLTSLGSGRLGSNTQSHDLDESRLWQINLRIPGSLFLLLSAVSSLWFHLFSWFLHAPNWAQNSAPKWILIQKIKSLESSLLRIQWDVSEESDSLASPVTFEIHIGITSTTEKTFKTIDSAFNFLAETSVPRKYSLLCQALVPPQPI